MKHHAHVSRTILACALLALAAAVNPASGAADGTNATDFSWDDPGIQAAAPPEVISPAVARASITDLAETGESIQASEAPVITPAAPTVTTNGLLRFTSKAEFQAAFPGLPIEDFEGGTTAAGFGTVCTAPLDNTSTCAGLTIVDGLSITGPPSTSVVVVGSGFGAWAPASTSLATVAAADTHQIAFTGGNVNAVGFDLTGFGATTATVNVFGASGLLQTLSVNITTVTQTFTGIYSTEPITFITVTAGLIRVIDNIQFGAIPTNLTFYTSQTAFTAAHPGLPLEDFEESPIADDTYLFIPEPLDSSSNIPGGFAPGDILPGLSLGTVAQPGGTSQAIVGANTVIYGNQTVMIAPVSAPSNLAVSFTGNGAYAVGMDLMVGSLAADILIIVYGPHGVIIGSKMPTIQNTETFFGVYSQQPITKIAVMNNSRLKFVDNIRFGGSPAGLTFYNSQASFLAARPGLPVEDFEESTASSIDRCDEPFASNSSNCFAPGDILPGIAFQTVEKNRICAGGANCPMAVVAPGVLGVPSYGVGPNGLAQNLEIAFTKQNVRYFGTDVMVVQGGPGDMLFSVYDDHDNFIGSALRNIGTTPVYLGVVSSRHLSRITITNPGSPAEIVDNVRFGAFPWQTIVPAISGH